ncbi:helix-turn-helix domain-containing protein [Nocardia brasiliensis]|uniref:helix-turn-helix domain-containing protein n=1 Tax=Nocardia brasiliensis TaxID=37326 RepID=UPI0024544B6F|nr:helix-turn-helix domain-containing protein [Nocardia brasiliensis]
MTPRLYSPAEAAEALGVTEDWLVKQLRARKLPGRKAGRFWKMAEQDIEAAIDSFAVPVFTPTADPSGLSSRSRRRLRGATA